VRPRLVDLGPLSNIHEIWQASGRPYGADRVHGQLRRDGIRVGRKRVERLMAAHGWQGAFLRRGWRGGTTRQNPRATPALDLVNQRFSAPAPNRLWVADATRIPCGQGAFWLAAVRDVFSRRIVGWKTGRPATGATPTSSWRPRIRHLVPRRTRRPAHPPQRQGLEP
jgi:transposase InsO family protein